MRAHRRNLLLTATILAMPLTMSVAEPLSPGAATTLNDHDAATTEKVVSQLHQLAEESRRGAPQFSMIGEVSGSGASWWVNGEEFLIDDSTVITGELRSGKMVEIRGLLGDGRRLVARHVTVLEGAGSSAAPGQRLTPADARMLR